MHLYESSKKLVAELRENLDQATNWLQHAESEFRENAFDPFWVAVENGAKNLAGYNSKARTLSENANQYHLKLKDREHTFPVFPIQGKTIPDASFAAREFRRIVRMGQTGPTFAIIEQHRRTREVLIAGFRTLGDAVNNLGANFTRAKQSNPCYA